MLEGKKGLQHLGASLFYVDKILDLFDPCNISYSFPKIYSLKKAVN